MIKQLSISLSEYLAKNNNSLTEKDILKIQYTLQVLLGDLTKLTIIFLIFLFLNELSLFFLIFFILISTRPLLGGIHCKTYNSCLIVSIMYFIIILLFSNFSEKLNVNFYLVFFIVFFIITFAYVPCHNEKRPVKNKAILKILSLISLTFWVILFFEIPNIRLSNCIFVSIFLQIVQVCVVSMKGGVFYAKIYKSIFKHTN